MEKFIVTHEENGVLVAESTRDIQKKQRAPLARLYVFTLLNPLTLGTVAVFWLMVYVYSNIY